MNPRWRWLLPLAVPLAVAGICGTTILMPAWTSWSRLRDARIEAVDESALRQARSEAARLSAILAEDAAGRPAEPPLPASVAQIEGIAVVRGLAVIGSSAKADAAGELRLAPDERSRLRRIELEGTYDQVVAYLGSLADRPQSIAVRLTLDQAPRDGQPARWSLLIAP